MSGVRLRAGSDEDLKFVLTAFQPSAGIVDWSKVHLSHMVLPVARPRCSIHYASSHVALGAKLAAMGSADHSPHRETWYNSEYNEICILHLH